MTPQAPRPLGALDLSAAAALHQAAFAGLGERGWSRQELAELLAAPGVRGLLVEADDRLAGIAVFRWIADEAELLTLAVDRSARGRGTGWTLLDGVVEAVRAAGARRLFLEVACDNDAACALYRRAGFVPAGERKAYYARHHAPPADALVMRLDLVPIKPGEW
ncbi:MAG: GNAT family N-acetyltransferase [Reyranellaceae bacterium]